MIGDGWARGEECGVVAWNIGNDSADDARLRGGGKPAALYGRQVLAHDVHCGDRHAGGEKDLVEGDLVLECKSVGRRGQKGRASAADQRDDKIILRKAGNGIEQAPGADEPRHVRHRKGGFENFDEAGRAAIDVAGQPGSGKRTGTTASQSGSTRTAQERRGNDW